MYCKLFASLYQGTLRGKSHEILVFTNLLATCDKEGFVDKHFKAISEEVGLTLDEVKFAIERLEAPDPESRSEELGGARIERIEEHRNWGWRVVNYVKYSEIINQEERREYQRIRQAEYRSKKRNGSKMSHTLCDKGQMSQEFTHIDVNIDTNTNVESVTSNKKKKVTDEEFISSLIENHAYHGIDVKAQLAKMDAWLLANPNRQKTRRFVVSWLNRCDKPLIAQSNGQEPNKKYSFDFLDKNKKTT